MTNPTTEQQELFSLTITLKNYWGKPVRQIISGQDLEGFMHNKMDEIKEEHKDVDGGWEEN